MENETLAGLTAAFADWRRKKRHVREAVPGELLERARGAIEVHGLGAVVRATKVEGMRLRKGSARRGKSTSAAVRVPTYSRVELRAAPTAGPFAEVETSAGVKVRFFMPSDEALALLSTLCGVGAVP